MTTANYAIVESGVVTNVIVWDGNTDSSTGGWQPPEGRDVIPVAPPTDIGWSAVLNADGTWTFNPPTE
ncbi:hypothetical protein LGN03_08965 [Burkholderia multivorans]|nr:hypothetical protein [Burkholderia multivorans]